MDSTSDPVDRVTTSLRRTAVVTVVVILAMIAVGAFLLAFRGQTAYMVTVAGYPVDTAWTGPAVVEGTLAMTLLAGLVLDLRPWTWPWTVVWGAMALAAFGSVFGNVYVASLTGMSTAGVVTHGSWSIWVIISELVAVIVVKRAWPRPVSPAVKPAVEDEPAGVTTVWRNSGGVIVPKHASVLTVPGPDVASARPVVLPFHRREDTPPGIDQAAADWVGVHGPAAALDKATVTRLAALYAVSDKTVRRRISDAKDRAAQTGARP